MPRFVRHGEPAPLSTYIVSDPSAAAVATIFLPLATASCRRLLSMPRLLTQPALDHCVIEAEDILCT
ncbi:MAG: hypothetical protein ACYC9L_15170, partial [Sulfuricaulis sp.]